MFSINYVQVAQWKSVRLKTSRSLVQIQSWTLMVIFFLTSIIIFLSVEFLSVAWVMFDQFLFFDNFFLYIFSIFFLLNFFYIKNEEKFNFNFDLLYKYILFLLKTPNYFLNYFLNNLKKIYVYLVYFKYKFLKDTHFMLIKKYFNRYFLIWRPLFKKFSYFGYYRSNRSKWIK